MDSFLYDRVGAILNVLKTHLVVQREVLKDVQFLKCGYKKGSVLPSLEDPGWRIFGPNEFWGGEKDTHAWFYQEIVLPESMRGLSVELTVDTGVSGWDATNPQFLVYVDGHLEQGLDVNHRSVTLQGKERYHVFFYAYSGMIDDLLRFSASLEVIDPLCETVYYHLYVPYGVLGYLEPKSQEYIEILEYLNEAVNCLDLRAFDTPAYRASLQAASEYLETHFYGKYCAGQDASAICIGHTHIDVAWLWTFAQTKEKVQRSFSTVLRLMERYPEYRFMSSQAQLYAFLKEESPETYEEVKVMIAAGRWEVEGAMWVEADCNLSSGESLIRQILYGKRFFKEEFGVDSRVLWLPDVFGYSAALPQILKKSGVDRFVTSKISWNDRNIMPYDTFLWRGIDGTEVLSYFLTAQDKVRGKEPVNFTTYNATTEPSEIAGAWERYQQKDLNKEVLVTYGYGDGGGGPTRHQIEVLRRMKNGMKGCPNARPDMAGAFLDRLACRVTENPRLPKWDGELYLELHRGTYTSIAKNKRNNRKTELLFQKAEWLSVLDGLLNGSPCPRESLQEAWKKILLCQFHDVVPGSSIREVYEDTDRIYETLSETGGRICESAARRIAGQVSTAGGWLVWNPHSFQNSGIVKIDGKSVFVSEIPAKGYRVVQPHFSQSRVSFADHQMENDFFRVRFNGDGTISEIYDKRCGREVLAQNACANVLQVFEDFPKEWDAWDIAGYYQEKQWEITEVCSFEPIEDGARAGFAVVKQFQKSKIVQHIYLYDDIPKIDFETWVDWQESHLLLKAAFPVAVRAQRASYEIQFGSVERPTHENTSWDSAKFEVCAHKYVDLSEYGYGVSLLNDCKYGHDIHDGVIRITLIKSATYPNPEADRGEHRFTYSLYPHEGDYRTAGTIQQAYNLNLPMEALPVKKQSGVLPESFSLISCSNPNVILETVKPAETGDGIILRLYEACGGQAKTMLSFGIPIVEAAICDLLENPMEKIDCRKDQMELCFHPFEITTVKVYFDRRVKNETF